jgi:signal transduction histidine kinase
MGMDFTGVVQRLRALQQHRSQATLRAVPLRAELTGEILVVTLVAFAAEVILLWWVGTSAKWFSFITVQSGAWLLAAVVCYGYYKRKSSPTAAMFAAIWLFVGITEMATLPLVQHPYPQYGGVIVLVTVLAGLLISGWYVPAFTLVACVVPLSQADSPGWNWTVYAGWCVVYVAAGWVVRRFTKHLERWFEVSRVAEERQRSAIVAERTRFARDLHDTLAQGFTGIMMQLNAAEQRMQDDPDEAHTHIHRARQLANDSLEEARRSVSALRSAALSNGTLLDAIAQMGQTLTQSAGVQLGTTLEGQPYALTEPCEANLLRIAQEAMTNAVRHAGASSIYVHLSYRTASVVLEVGDTGHGMSGGESSGFGIDGMRHRTREIGGEIRILSDPGRGTRIIVTVPNA